MKKLMFLVSMMLSAVLFASCSMANKNSDMPEGGYYRGGDTYTQINEEGFIDVTDDTSKSYISLSVNTAAYTDIKNRVFSGYSVDVNAVKIEEMVNYFSYSYPEPQGGKPLSYSAAVTDTPWNDETKLLMLGMKAEEVKAEDRNNNIVFLIDVSGSMFGNDRLGLVVEAFCLLTDQLTAGDRVSIVTYASGVRESLKGATGEDKELIKSKLRGLSASGATAGGQAIQRAYDIAAQYHSDDRRSCVIIATDGDFNVGISTSDALKAMISEKKDSGIYMSAIGVGMGNMRSDMLETIADSGGGRHGYIGSMADANKFFVEELSGIFNTVAEDAKAQIEFNTERVSAYRLIGYENRQLSLEDWLDSGTNAGNIGSGLEVTAVYEIKLKDDGAGDIAKLSLKYKTPDTKEDKEELFAIGDSHLNPASDADGVISREDIAFITGVIETGLLLRNSEYKGTASYQAVIDRLSGLDLSDEYKSEFKELVTRLSTR